MNPKPRLSAPSTAPALAPVASAPRRSCCCSRPCCICSRRERAWARAPTHGAAPSWWKKAWMLGATSASTSSGRRLHDSRPRRAIALAVVGMFWGVGASAVRSIEVSVSVLASVSLPNPTSLGCVPALTCKKGVWGDPLQGNVSNPASVGEFGLVVVGSTPRSRPPSTPMGQYD